jgi:hypothetical protein
MLSASQITKFGLFRQDSVEKLMKKISSKAAITENDHMAIAGILSTQILTDIFISGNGSFRETKMQMACPVYHQKQTNDSYK